MKIKSYMFVAMAATMLAACDQDFGNWTEQKVNDQDAITSFQKGTVTPAATNTNVNLNTLADGTTDIQVCTIAAPTVSDANYSSTYKIALSAVKSDNTEVEQTFDLTAEGNMAVADLQEFLTGIYGTNPNIQRTVTAKVLSIVSNGVTTTTYTSDPFTINANVKAPFIDANGYYVVGNIDDWSCSRKDEYHMVNGGGDVYDDPVFTVTIPAVADITTYEVKMIPASSFNDDGSVASWDKAVSAEPGADDPASEGNVSLSNAGGNLKFNAVPNAEKYKISVNMLLGTYAIEGILPPALFLTGDHYNWGGTWLPLHPVNNNWGGTSPYTFWTIIYLHAGELFKFSPVAGWSGDFGGNQLAVTDEAGAGISEDGTNCKADNAGWYLLEVSSANRTMTVHKAEIFLIGDVTGDWTSGVEANKFTVPATEDGEFVSPVLANNGNLRMYAQVGSIDWWRTEFNVINGQIVVRESDELPGVSCTAGQKVTLNFKNNTGSIQ